MDLPVSLKRMKDIEYSRPEAELISRCKESLSADTGIQVKAEALAAHFYDFIHSGKRIITYNAEKQVIEDEGNESEDFEEGSVTEDFEMESASGKSEKVYCPDMHHIWDIILYFATCIPPHHMWQDALLNCVALLGARKEPVPSAAAWAGTPEKPTLWSYLPELRWSMREMIDQGMIPLFSFLCHSNIVVFLRWEIVANIPAYRFSGLYARLFSASQLSVFPCPSDSYQLV
jgi:hypothetical protein